MNKTEYFVFHKEWYELRKELSAKAWVELEDYMLKLRFDGIDTDPKSIKNKTIRLQWIMIRKKIYDSINNMKRQKKHRSQNNPDLSASNALGDNLYHQAEESPSNRQEIPINEGFESQSDSPLKEEHVEVRNLPNNPTILITDEEKYGNEVMDLLDEYGNEVHNALRAQVDYYDFKDTTKEILGKGSTDKINKIKEDFGLQDEVRFLRYCLDYMKEYKENKETNNYI